MIKENILYQYQKLQERWIDLQYDGRFVAMFHQVEEDKNKWYDERYVISVSCFQEFVRKLQENGYQIVSPYDLLNSDGKKKVVLTFDDVFEGVYYEVYPFLKRNKIPFVVFPAIKMLKMDGYIDEAMLLEMATEYNDCYVGAHGLTHCNLRKVSKEQCWKEIVESKIVLENLIGKPVDMFAYPYGSLDAVGRRERIMVGCKYQIAFGTIQSGVTKKTDSTYVPRINVNEENYNCIWAKSTLC